MKYHKASAISAFGAPYLQLAWAYSEHEEAASDAHERRQVSVDDALRFCGRCMALMSRGGAGRCKEVCIERHAPPHPMPTTTKPSMAAKRSREHDLLRSAWNGFVSMCPTHLLEQIIGKEFFYRDDATCRAPKPPSPPGGPSYLPPPRNSPPRAPMYRYGGRDACMLWSAPGTSCHACSH